MDYYEKYGIAPSLSAAEATLVRSCNGTRGLETESKNYRGLAPLLEYEDGNLRSILIKPIELSFCEKDKAEKGLPHEADEKVTAEIFETLVRISAAYGTRIKLNHGLIEVIL